MSGDRGVEGGGGVSCIFGTSSPRAIGLALSFLNLEN